MSWFKTSLTCSLLLTLAAVFTFAYPDSASADPSASRAESIITEIDLGESSFRLINNRPAIPTDGGYLFTVEITPGDDLISVNLHFQLMREEDGWPFHYFGDPIYIERDTADDDEVDESDQDDADSTATRRIAQPEVIHHELRRRTGDHLDGLGMHEGVYYVAVIVTITTDEGTESATLRDLLVVYDPAQPKLNMMPVVQISAVPARDIEGNFLSSPATGAFEERRALLESVSDWVHRNQQARLTLAISPLFLEDLYDVSQGLSYYIDPNAASGTNNGTNNGSNGNTGSNGSNGNGDSNSGDFEEANGSAIPAYNLRAIAIESDAAVSSARTLEALRIAYGTGRLTIAVQGYADPNFAVLSALDLEDDIAQHYDLGCQVIQDVLGIEPSAITVPWSNNRLNVNNINAMVDLLPLSAISPGTREDRPRFVGASTTARFGTSAALTEDSSMFGFQPLARTDGVDIIMADYDLSTALSTEASRAQFISELLELRQNVELVPVLVRAHDDIDPVTTLIDNLDRISHYDWISLVDGGFTPDAGMPTAPLLDAQTLANSIRSAPTSIVPPANPFEHAGPLSDSIQALQSSRNAFLGLHGSLYQALPSEDLDTANQFEVYNRASLAAFAGPGTEVRLVANEISILTSAVEGIDLARQVNASVDYWFDGLSLEVQSMNFSGSGGLLPVGIENNSEHDFYLTVRYVSPGHTIIIYPEYTYQAFMQGETFLEPAIELRNISSGLVDVQLWAGNYLIAEENVRVSATYIDRIVIIVLVVLAGAGLALFVWKRTQSKDDTKAEVVHGHAGGDDQEGVSDLSDLDAVLDAELDAALLQHLPQPEDENQSESLGENPDEDPMRQGPYKES